MLCIIRPLRTEAQLCVCMWKNCSLPNLYYCRHNIIRTKKIADTHSSFLLFCFFSFSFLLSAWQLCNYQNANWKFNKQVWTGLRTRLSYINCKQMWIYESRMKDNRKNGRRTTTKTALIYTYCICGAHWAFTQK